MCGSQWAKKTNIGIFGQNQANLRMARNLFFTFFLMFIYYFLYISIFYYKVADTKAILKDDRY